MNLEHRWLGEYGALMGHSSGVMDFPDDSLTVAALASARRSSR
jgi:hypothetical protein